MLVRSPYAELALTHIEARLARPDRPAPVALGWAWARAREAHLPEGASRLLALRDRLGAAGRAAVAGWIESLAVRRDRWSLALLALWNWSWLRAGDETWAAIGFALDQLGLPRLSAWWMRDWRERTSARPVQLVPLLFALWDLERRLDAQALCRHACALPRDHASLLWDAYAALEHALAGRVAPAGELLTRPAGTDPVARAVQSLARAVIAARRVPATDDAQFVYAAVWSHLEQAGQALSRAPELVRPYDEAVLAIIAARPPEQRDALRYRIARIP
jgi:hypothetical protein